MLSLSLIFNTLKLEQMKKLLFTLFLFIVSYIVQGQSHTYKIGCRFSKLYNSEAGCPACNKEKEDERKAKQAEDKRRSDVVAAKNKADKNAAEAEQKRLEEKKKEDAKNKTLQIGVPKNESLPKPFVTKAGGKTKVYQAKDKRKQILNGYFRGLEDGSNETVIFNEGGDTVIRSSEFLIDHYNFASGGNSWTATKSPPKDVIIIVSNKQIANKSFPNSEDYSPKNLINSKGEFLLANNVKNLYYLGNSIFLIEYDSRAYSFAAKVGLYDLVEGKLHEFLPSKGEETYNVNFARGIEDFGDRLRWDEEEKVGTSLTNIINQKEWIVLLFHTLDNGTYLKSTEVLILDKNRKIQNLGIYTPTR